MHHIIPVSIFCIVMMPLLHLSQYLLSEFITIKYLIIDFAVVEVNKILSRNSGIYKRSENRAKLSGIKLMCTELCIRAFCRTAIKQSVTDGLHFGLPGPSDRKHYLMMERRRLLNVLMISTLWDCCSRPLKRPPLHLLINWINEWRNKVCQLFCSTNGLHVREVW